MRNTSPARPILRERETCWRIEHASRAAVLIDAAAYYGALRAALLKAERSVFIAGWDIDSRTRLVGPSGAAEDGAPERLSAFLTHLVERRPNLRIHLLLWDYSMLYALEREPWPSLQLDWSTPEQISVCLDDVLPIGASHHQKIAVIDDVLAFSGGLDLTVRRWDTPAHRLHDPRRADPRGEPYRPFHDVQMMVEGEAAAALGELVRARWQDAACETPVAPAPGGDRWPDGLAPDFRDVPVGIARTVAAYDGAPEIREVEALHLRAIEAAERAVYIENQFVTADSVAGCLVRRMKENPALEVLIVSPNAHHGWLEEQSMNAGRRRFMRQLEAAGLGDRVRLLHPALPEDETGEGVMVHAKVMVVDDRLVRVGSANLNNRSMGLDTECDLAVEAGTPAARRAVADIRNRLLAEHLGTDSATVARAIARRGSLIAASEALSGGPRALRPIDRAGVPDGELAQAVGQVADPERPIAPPPPVGDMFNGAPAAPPAVSRALRLAAIGLVLVALVAAWRYTPLAAFTRPETLVTFLARLADSAWMPVLLPAVYVLGGLVCFPVTVLIVVTGMMLDPLPALAYAFVGAGLSAALTYMIGRRVGRSPLRRLAGTRVNRIGRALARRGVLSVTALRMIPIAPFTIINLAVGASRIGFADYMLGTLLGMAPGIVVISLVGHQLARVLSDPGAGELLILGLCIAGWLVLSLALQRLASRLRARRNG